VAVDMVVVVVAVDMAVVDMAVVDLLVVLAQEPEVVVQVVLAAVVGINV
jgi:hypothetical protein